MPVRFGLAGATGGGGFPIRPLSGHGGSARRRPPKTVALMGAAPKRGPPGPEARSEPGKRLTGAGPSPFSHESTGKAGPVGGERPARPGPDAFALLTRMQNAGTETPWGGAGMFAAPPGFLSVPAKTRSNRAIVVSFNPVTTARMSLE